MMHINTKNYKNILNELIYQIVVYNQGLIILPSCLNQSGKSRVGTKVLMAKSWTS